MITYYSIQPATALFGGTLLPSLMAEILLRSSESASYRETFPRGKPGWNPSAKQANQTIQISVVPHCCTVAVSKMAHFR